MTATKAQALNPMTARLFDFRRALWCLFAMSALVVGGLTAEAQVGSIWVKSAPAGPPKFPSQPNGKFTTGTEDLRVKVPGGLVLWTREYDGNQWKMNARWTGLAGKFDEKPMGGVSVAYGSGTGPGGSGGGGVALARPTTENSDPPEVFGGTGVPGGGGIRGDEMELGVGPLNAISRNGSIFYADDTHMVFVAANPRYVIKPILAAGFNGTRDVSFPGGVTATYTGVFQQDLLPGGGVLGWRWQDKTGDWIEYDRNGAITRYGDRNNVTVSFEYESGTGYRRIRALRDNANNVVLELGYSAQFPNRIVEVREPAGTATEPARRVQYEYSTDGNISRVIDVLGNSVRHEYDTTRRLTAIIDQENAAFRIQYGDTGRMSRTTAEDGGVTDYVYDYDKTRREFFVRISYPETAAGRRVEERWYNNEGRLLRVTMNGNLVAQLDSDPKDLRTEVYTDARGNSRKFSRNSFDLATSMQLEDGSTYQVEYDSKFLNVVSETNEEGVRTLFTYDERGNLSGVRQAAGTSDERRSVVVTDAAGNITSWKVLGRTEVDGTVTQDSTETYEYDDHHNLVRYTDEEGFVVQYEYNRVGELIRVVEPRGGIWKLTYNAFGDIQTLTDPLNHTVQYGHDRVGNMTSYRGTRGFTSSWTYDPAGRTTALVNPYGAELRSAFDKDGNLLSQIDASGKGMRLEYDSSGRMKRGVDAKGFDYQFDYTDEDGVDKGLTFASRIKYPTLERRYRFDSRQRGTQRTDITATDSFVRSYTYDRVGRQRSTTDPNGKTRYFDFNALGQVTALRDPLGNSVSMAYDARGDLLRVTDARGHATRFTNDRRGLLTTETDPLGKITRYGYDDNGALTSVRLPNGQRTEFDFDLAGRMTERRSYDASNTLSQRVTFAYDEDDNLTGWNDGVHSSVITYDNDSRMTGETVNYGAFSLGYAYTYYDNGQVRTYTGPDGVTITYSYDAAGQLERTSIPGEGDIAVTDWTWSSRKKVLLPGGASQEFEYTGLLDMTRMRVKTASQQTLFEFENKYGLLQEVTERTVDGHTVNYEYDDAYHLKGVTGDTTVSYTLDAAGNRISASPVPGTWTYDNANQLTAKGGVTYSYDDNGNLTRKVDSARSEPQRTTNFSYDSLNRLIEVRNGANALVARYTYDPFDLRLSKEVFIGPDAGTTYYLHALQGLLAEATAAGVVTTSYGWHPTEDYGTNALYARVPAASGGGYRYVYFHNDQLGTPYRVTDKEGNLVWSAAYDTFGNATLNALPSSSAALAITNNLRFGGQYYDSETGLHYNNRRYYDNDTGRYITRDPLGFDGGSNLYSYVLHNPVNFYDPTGEILPCLLANYLRCVVSCVAMGKIAGWISGCPTDLGDLALQCAKDCIWSLIPFPNACGMFGKLIGMGMAAAGANSFTGDTLVHTRGDDGKPKLKPISEVKVGDEVLAWAEWLDKADYSSLEEAGTADVKSVDSQTLRYEKVTDLFTSHREQTLVHITLDTGETLTATAGHPMRTTEGWRDAVLLKRGGKLLTFGDGEPADSKLRTATILEVRQETVTIDAFNLEVERTHTFFVGEDGYVVHNGQTIYCIRAPGKKPYYGRTKDKRFNQRMKEHERSGRKPPGSKVTKLKTNVPDKKAPGVEQGYIDRGGGPSNKGNGYSGGTSNRRNERRK